MVAVQGSPCQPTPHTHTYDNVDQGFSTGVPWNPRVPRDVARSSARYRDLKK
jgi:hypothetical protein